MGYYFINKKFIDMKLKTFTIGIPAHNEEKNIGNLLEQILKQNKSNYKLESVIVICDGCTDDTEAIARKFAKTHKFIRVISDGKRLGKINRLNQLYKIAQSDIYLTIDADILLESQHTISKLLNGFKNNVGLVGGCSLPLPAQNKFEKILTTWNEFWYLAKRDVNKGDNVNNHFGCISAMSKALYKQVTIPHNIYSDDDFLYFNSKKLKFEFLYSDDAKVYFRSANTFSDFIKQHTRFLTLKDNVAEHYGKSIYKKYFVPFSDKRKALFKILKKEPIFMILALILQIYLRSLIKINKEKYINGFWTYASSSKNTNINLKI